MIKAILFDMDGVIADTEMTRLELLKIIRFSLLVRIQTNGLTVGNNLI